MSEYICGTDGHDGHWLTGEVVVRCRDCAKCEESKVYGKWFCHRFSMCDGAGFPVEPDGFCAWGVRREEA